MSKVLSAEQPWPDDRLFVRRANVPALASCSEWPSQDGDTVSVWTEENSAPGRPSLGIPIPGGTRNQSRAEEWQG